MRLETIRKVPLCGIACQNIIAVIKEKTFQKNFVINGDYKVGEMMMTNVYR
jgi:hypothetical protein